MPARMATTATTIISSISVKPAARVMRAFGFTESSRSAGEDLPPAEAARGAGQQQLRAGELRAAAGRQEFRRYHVERALPRAGKLARAAPARDEVRAGAARARRGARAGRAARARRAEARRIQQEAQRHVARAA